ncbi:MAG: hypothetical protein D6683_03120 [Actinomyces sp.]|nr:MAG: hypothetical protein D6683_03120 [Actinomyces sp.]
MPVLATWARPPCCAAPRCEPRSLQYPRPGLPLPVAHPLRCRLVALHLVRHASAGRRRDGLDDLERPLDVRGRHQAELIAARLADAPVRRIVSSLATRCRQTVEPLARHHGLTVETRRDVTEGADPVALVELLRADAHLDGDLVVCSHGDLIPEALGLLLREGMVVVGGRGCEKGSIWSLETRGRDIVRAVYDPLA